MARKRPIGGMSDFLKYRLISRLIENVESVAKAEENVEKLICDKTFSTSLYTFSAKLMFLCSVLPGLMNFAN